MSIHKTYKPLQKGDPWPFRSKRGITGDPCDPAWYAMITRPQKEAIVKNQLQGAGCVVRYPVREKVRHQFGKKRTYVIPIIPRIIYVYSRYEMRWDVMKTRGIIMGVFSQDSKPIKIDGDRVADIMNLPEEMARLADEKIDAITPRVGEKAVITDGPFADFLVDVVKVEAGRVWWEYFNGNFRINGEDASRLVQRVVE